MESDRPKRRTAAQKRKHPDPKRSRAAKKANRDPETRKKKEKGQDEYERTGRAKRKHKQQGRVTSRQNQMKKALGQESMDVILSLTSKTGAKTVSEALFQERISRNAVETLSRELRRAFDDASDAEAEKILKATQELADEIKAFKDLADEMADDLEV